MYTYDDSLFAPPARCFPFTLKDITICIQSWQLSGQRLFAEQSAADGSAVITNTAQRGRQLVLDGIWITDNDPDSLILTLDEYISSGESFDFSVRKLHFSECRIMKYSASEKGDEPYVKLRLELFSAAAPTEISEEVSV